MGHLYFIEISFILFGLHWIYLSMYVPPAGSQMSDKCVGLDQLNVCAVVTSPDNDFRDTDRTLSFSSTIQRVMAVVDDVTTPALRYDVMCMSSVVWSD